MGYLQSWNPTGPFGDIQQIGCWIVGEIDYLFFCRSDDFSITHDTADVKALTKLAGVENIHFLLVTVRYWTIITGVFIHWPNLQNIIHPKLTHNYTQRFYDFQNPYLKQCRVVKNGGIKSEDNIPIDTCNK